MADRTRKTYTLKNGAKIEGGVGRAALRSLEGLLEQRPELLRALLAIVRGQREEVNPQDIELLKDSGYLRATDGAVCADLPDVLLSAYQETQEGPVLANPFRFENAAEARESEEGERQGIDKLIRKLRKDDGTGGPPARK